MRDLKVKQVESDVVDIQLGPDGDVAVVGGDFALCTDMDAIEQAIRFRLLTQLGSWPLVPECGSALSEYAGAPNTAETGEVIRAEILRALTHDGFLMFDEVDVEVAPISPDTLYVLITVQMPPIALQMQEYRTAFQFELSLITGGLSGWQRVEF